MASQPFVPGASAPGAPTLAGGQGVGAGMLAPEGLDRLGSELMDSCNYIVYEIRNTVNAAGGESSVTLEAYRTFKYIMFGNGRPHPFIVTLAGKQLDGYTKTFDKQKIGSIMRVVDACKQSYKMKFIDFSRGRITTVLPLWKDVVAWSEEIAAATADDKLSWAAMELNYLIDDVQRDTVEEVLHYRHNMTLLELNSYYKLFGGIMPAIAAALDEGYLANVLLEEIVSHLKRLGVETDVEELVIQFGRW